MKEKREVQKNPWTGLLIHSGEVNSIAELAIANKADLSGANLSGANLSGANLSDANLSDANLSGADLSGADLSGANLSDANLSGADLSGADLSGANLRGADLSGADLSGADLSGANLSDANLSDANLSGANLSGANLSVCRDDLWAVLCSAPREVLALRQALIDGKVNGSTYSGECACLVGTLANARHCSYDAIPGLKPDSNRPAERFFLAIKPGDTPETNQASKLALEWVDEWIANMRAFAAAAI